MFSHQRAQYCHMNVCGVVISMCTVLSYQHVQCCHINVHDVISATKRTTESKIRLTL